MLIRNKNRPRTVDNSDVSIVPSSKQEIMHHSQYLLFNIIDECAQHHHNHVHFGAFNRQPHPPIAAHSTRFDWKIIFILDLGWFQFSKRKFRFLKIFLFEPVKMIFFSFCSPYIRGAHGKTRFILDRSIVVKRKIFV